MRIEILNVPFDNVTNAEALARLLEFLGGDGCHILCTPNPEMVLLAEGDTEFMEVLQNADLVVPDGIGVIWASRVLKRPLKERVAGCDLMFALFDAIKTTENTVYMLGGQPGVAALAAENMQKKFPGLRIIGHHHGYFSDKDEQGILDEITRLAPDVLLVGLGAGRQEKWMYRKRALPVKLSVGVGGSLDVMAGTVKRAPVVFQKLGLEWFYRLLSQPSRVGRMLKLPLFAVIILKKRIGRD